MVDISILILASILSLILWIIGLVLLAQNWHDLSTSVQVLSVILLIPGIPLGSIVIIFGYFKRFCP